ncbi:MAG: cobalamin-dependent protein, partial [Candidatus Diapherotrites archaeon]|nr:cobalamin-dependent protein [Candidatus Diapherotrites archaeon]
MKILMLNPPFLFRFSRTSRSPGISRGGCVYFPIWMAYTTGVLEKEGHKINLIDAPARGIELKETIKIAEEFNPELIVVDTVTASFKNDVKVVEALKKALPKAFTIMVGTHTGPLPEESLKASKSIDAVARGEFDFIIKDLAQALEKKEPLSGVKGISYKEKG